MKRIIVLASILIASVASAETYKWEDAQGMHFTDNADSIPKKHRAKALAEARGDITMRDPEVARSVDEGVRRTRAKEAQEVAAQQRQLKLAAAASKKQQADEERKQFAREVAKEVDRLSPAPSLFEDHRQHDMQDKIDRIDRKLRFGL